MVVRTDREASAALEEARGSGATSRRSGCSGGDLCRTLGGRGDEARLRGDEVALAPADVGEVLLDGRVRYFVAHVVVRRGGGAGRSWRR